MSQLLCDCIQWASSLHFLRWTGTKGIYTRTPLWLSATHIGSSTFTSRSKHSAGSEWFKKVCSLNWTRYKAWSLTSLWEKQEAWCYLLLMALCVMNIFAESRIKICRKLLTFSIQLEIKLTFWILVVTTGSKVQSVSQFSPSPALREWESVGILLRPLAIAACLWLLCQGSKWISSISVWLVFRLLSPLPKISDGNVFHCLFVVTLIIHFKRGVPQVAEPGPGAFVIDQWRGSMV